MALDPLTGFNFDEAAGTMDVAAQKSADDHLLVQFFLYPVVDYLLTEGGEIPKVHPRVKELRAREAERLAVLRRTNPFTEEPPEKPAADAPEAAKALYAEQHAEWDLHRKRHDDELKELSAILQDHPENAKLYVVVKQGRPVYSEKEFVRIIKPGDRDSVLEVPLDEDYKKRFFPRYRLWKEKGDEALSGTPLKEVPFINSAQREEFAFFGVRTVEQLVSLSDTVKQHFMGINALIAKAQAWLDATTGGSSAIARLQADAEAKDGELAALRQAVADLQKQLASKGAVAEPSVEATVERLQRESGRGRR